MDLFVDSFLRLEEMGRHNMPVARNHEQYVDVSSVLGLHDRRDVFRAFCDPAGVSAIGLLVDGEDLLVGEEATVHPNTESLKAKIVEVCGNLDETKVEGAFETFRSRLERCIAANGGYFESL